MQPSCFGHRLQTLRNRKAKYLHTAPINRGQFMLEGQGAGRQNFSRCLETQRFAWSIID